MKPTILIRISVSVSLYLLFMLAPIHSFAQTFVGLSSSPIDNGSQTNASVAVTPVGSMQAGDLVVIYAHYRHTGNTLAIDDDGGQSWTSETQSNGTNQRTRIFWCVYNGSWPTNPSVDGGGSSRPMSVIMYVYRPNNSGSSWGKHLGPNSATTTATAVPVTGYTTTEARTVTMAFWASQAATTWGAVSGTGWVKPAYTGATTTQVRNTGGSDQSHTAAYNIRTTAGAVANTSQTQSASQETRTSIITWYEIPTPVPGNDLCANATPLTSSTSCSNTAGTLSGATYTAIPSIDCGTASRNDVWYSFVANSPNPTITLSSYPNNARIQLFSGSCTGLVSEGCANAPSLTTSGLTMTNTYWIRVYADPNTYGTFNICVVDPPPVNDLCSSPTAITSSGTCNFTSGTLLNATYTAATGACGASSGNRNDVWYSFVAQSTNPTITLASAPSNASLQLYSTCAAAVSGANHCVLNGTTMNASGLTIGTTYRIRVFSNTNATGTFDICVTDPAPANDLCAGAINLNSAQTCSNTAGTLAGASYTATTGACGASSGNRNDVWYRFVAKTVNPTITLSSAPSQASLQLFSGACGSLTSLQCAVNSTSLVASGLTVDVTYYIRVWSDNNTSGTFNICVDDPAPTNSTCSNAAALTSSSTCTYTAGNVYGAGNSAPTISTPNCATGVTNDVWYSFVAQTINPTISIANLSTGFTNPGLQLLSGSCSGTLTPLFCGTTSLLAADLVPGTTYYIRVYSTTASLTAGAAFGICVTDPVTPAPSNDDCAGAINLPVFNSCSNNPGNMAGATPSSPALGGSCTGPLAYDVWYRFVAANTSSTITISSLGSNFTTSGIEVLSGTCTGGLTSIACATGTSVAPTGLIVGNTYFIRVYSRTAPPQNGNARFNICITTSGLPVRFGNSYVNISKKTTGGVVQPGDTLEIRMTINHTSGTMYRLRYVDNVPTNTAMLTGATDRLRVITNEGLFYKEYTLGNDADGGTYLASPPGSDYNVRMNLSFGSSTGTTPANNGATDITNTNGTMNAGSDNPRGGGGMIFATAFRVVVTGAIGDTITLNPGRFIYRTSTGGSDITLTGTPFKIKISSPLSLCASSVGVNNATEYGGTFGSGSTLNRSTDLTTPISGYTFINEMNVNNAVGDGRYAIVKNLSPRNGTVVNGRRVNACNTPTVLASDDMSNCNKRMYDGHWYVGGDHTGTNNATGNAPPSATTPGSYMLMVNADYVASEIFRQTINNLCPNTYYEFSAWVKNICPTCGMDSLGRQFNAAMPLAIRNGYPGVYPNLTFSLNDIDYYSTGEVDTLGWLKKGFVFLTDSNQTSATFSIRNNAQGGGGNDWTLDDIAVATCLPNMQYSPTMTPIVCRSNAITVYDTIRSYFNNYTYYKWQRSPDNGATWNDLTAEIGPVTPTLNGGSWEYITSWTIPPGSTSVADSGDLYRVLVATTAANLSNGSCQFTDEVNIITLNVMDCGIVLKADLLSFNGKLVNDLGVLSWTTSKEDEPITFDIEKSTDGVHFIKIGNVPGHGNYRAATNNYAFTDPEPVNGKVWYRIVMLNNSSNKKYSRIVQLSRDRSEFALGNVINPFASELIFEVILSADAKIDASLVDMFGRTVRKKTFIAYGGTNSLNFENTDILSPGIYILQVKQKDQILTRKVMKK